MIDPGQKPSQIAIIRGGQSLVASVPQVSRVIEKKMHKEKVIDSGYTPSSLGGGFDIFCVIGFPIFCEHVVFSMLPFKTQFMTHIAEHSSLYHLSFQWLTPGFFRSLDQDLGAIMKVGEEFDWQRINFVLEVAWRSPLMILSSKVRSKCVNDFMVEAQDKAKNALVKSALAAHAAWMEQLRGDQARFEAEVIACPDGMHAGFGS